MTTEATDTQHQILINGLQRANPKGGNLTTLLEMCGRDFVRVEQTSQGDSLYAFLKKERERYRL